MYRQRPEKQSSLETDEHLFVNRLLHLPLVATAMDQMNSLYSTTKERNGLMKRTMERAETGVSAVLGTAAVPVIFMFDRPLTTLNNFACDQLDKLENKYPIITKPTDEVVKATKDMCNTAVQPIVNRVSSAKKFGFEKVSDVRSFTGEKLDDVRSYGWTTVGSIVQLGNDQMMRVLTTVGAQHPLVSVGHFLETADRYVDSYLPPDHEGEDETKEKEQEKERGDEKERGGEKVEEGDGKTPSSGVVVSKALKLGSKVQRRLWSQTLKQVKRVQMRSSETLQKLNFTVDLIEYARTNFNETKEKMESIWTEVNKTDEEILKEETNEEKRNEEKRTRLERRAIATARQLTLGLKSTLSWLHDPHFVAIGAIPEVFSGQIRSLQERTQALVEVFSKEMVDGKDLTQSALNRARNLYSQIYSGVLHLVSNLTRFGGERKKSTDDGDKSEEESKPLPTEEEKDDQMSNNSQEENN